MTEFISQHCTKPVVGTEYVFGKHTAHLGFVPTMCAPAPHRCRLTVAAVSGKKIRAVGVAGKFDPEGFFEIEVAKELYRAALIKQGGEHLTPEKIQQLVDKL